MLAAWYKQIDSAGKCIPSKALSLASSKAPSLASSKAPSKAPSLAPSKVCNLHMFGNDGV